MATISNTSCRRIRFGPFEVDLRSRELRKNGAKLRLQGQPLQVLVILLEHSGEVVTREELRTAVWPGNFFGDIDHALNKAIAHIREAIGDSADRPHFIETLPRVGYRFVGTIEAIAEKSNEPAPVGIPSEVQQQTKPRNTRQLAFRLVSMLIAFFMALGLGSLLVWRVWVRSQQPSRITRVIPVTTLPGQEVAPALSPDGGRVAFGWDGESNGRGYDIYVKVVGNEGQLRLTHSPSPWVGTAWSPDGRFIAVARSGNKPGVFLVPALGGPERKIADGQDAMIPGMLLGWSPDGQRLAFVNTPLAHVVGTSSLAIVTLDSLAIEVLSSDCPRAVGPSFAPDGTAISYACIETWNNTSLRIRSLVNRNERILTRIKGWSAGTVWTPDGNYILYPVLSFDSSTEYELRIISVDGKSQSTEVRGTRHANMVSVGSDRLVFAEPRVNTNIWKVPIDGSGPALKVIASTAEQNFPKVSPDGKKIAFESTRSGNREIWISDVDGSNLVQISAFNGPLTGSPTWSSDSTQLAFDSRAGGEVNLYLADTSGQAIRKLQTGTELNSIPVWSRDGRWIYYQQGEDSNPTIWKLSTGDNHAVQLTTIPPILSPRESFDGKYLYSVRQNGSRTSLWRIRTDGSGEEKALEHFPIQVGGDFSPVEKGVFFIADVENKRRQEIQFLEFRTRKIKVIYRPPVALQDWTGGLEITPDGKWILFTQLDSAESDLKMLENWR
jgi:Tol biopolymer transport system component/DNA-binding winged helix-turn-helix (wHTH) protein